MKLAYQTNTWGVILAQPGGVTSVKDAYYLTNRSSEQALTDIAAAGYTGFELFDGDLMQYAGRENEFQSLLVQLKLQLVAVYAGANFIYPDILQDELSRIERAALFAKQMGAEHLVVGGGALRAEGIQKEDLALLGQGLDGVVAMGYRVGLTTSYHPHLGTLVEAPDQIAEVFEHTTINFCPDTAHQFAARGNPADLIRKYAARIKYVHLKDFKGGKFVPLGEGQLNFGDIFSALKEIHYDGWLTVELDGYQGNPREAAEKSKAFIEAAQAAG
jgi:inosose dehydratase